VHDCLVRVVRGDRGMGVEVVCVGWGERGGGGDIGAVLVGRARGHGVHGAGALLVPP
jgi:hypothetical protein